MSYFLKKFYQDVKDQSWPDIDSYSDYFKLPQWIRQQCEQVHGINDLFTKIEDENFCINLHTHGYRFENLVFVPVPKCASVYYSNMFETQMGWEKVSDFSSMDQSTVFFGVLMDPTTRWLKGLAQFLYYNNFTDDQTIHKLLNDKKNHIFSPDIHTMSYSMLLGPWLDKGTWFPMDFYNESQIRNLMQQLFQQHGHNIQLPPQSDKIHQSSSKQLELFQRLKAHQQQNFKDDQAYLLLVQTLLAKDLKFYRNLIKNISNG